MERIKEHGKEDKLVCLHACDAENNKAKSIEDIVEGASKSVQDGPGTEQELRCSELSELINIA